MSEGADEDVSEAHEGRDVLVPVITANRCGNPGAVGGVGFGVGHRVVRAQVPSEAMRTSISEATRRRAYGRRSGGKTWMMWLESAVDGHNTPGICASGRRTHGCGFNRLSIDTTHSAFVLSIL